jgi:hypothetical protein
MVIGLHADVPDWSGGDRAMACGRSGDDDRVSCKK